MIFWKSKHQRDKERFETELAEAVAEDERRHRAEMPTRPLVAPPAKGTIGVAVAQSKNNVWVWIALAEEDKRFLTEAGVLDSVVGYLLDKDELNELAQSYADSYRETDANIARLSGRPIPEDWDTPSSSELHKRAMKDSEITVRALLSNPFRKYIRDIQDAGAFKQRLKEEILPKLKSLIGLSSQGSSESFNL
jgi:hypothetical protein